MNSLAVKFSERFHLPRRQKNIKHFGINLTKVVKDLYLQNTTVLKETK